MSAFRDSIYPEDKNNPSRFAGWSTLPTASDVVPGYTVPAKQQSQGKDPGAWNYNADWGKFVREDNGITKKLRLGDYVAKFGALPVGFDTSALQPWQWWELQNYEDARGPGGNFKKKNLPGMPEGYTPTQDFIDSVTSRAAASGSGNSGSGSGGSNGSGGSSGGGSNSSGSGGGQDFSTALWNIPNIGGGMASNFNPDRNKTQDYGSIPTGEENVYDLDNPFAGLNRQARDASFLPVGQIENQFGSLASSPLGQFLAQRAQMVQRQFKLQQALGGGSLGPAAYKDFTNGVVQGFFGGQGSPSAYATWQQVPQILQALAGAAGQPLDSIMQSNPTLGTLLVDAGMNPDQFVTTIASLFQPHMDNSSYNAYRTYLMGKASDYLSNNAADQSRNGFAQALLGQLTGS